MTCSMEGQVNGHWMPSPLPEFPTYNFPPVAPYIPPQYYRDPPVQDFQNSFNYNPDDNQFTPRKKHCGQEASSRQVGPRNDHDSPNIRERLLQDNFYGHKVEPGQNQFWQPWHTSIKEEDNRAGPESVRNCGMAPSSELEPRASYSQSVCGYPQLQCPPPPCRMEYRQDELPFRKRKFSEVVEDEERDGAYDGRSLRAGSPTSSSLGLPDFGGIENGFCPTFQPRPINLPIRREILRDMSSEERLERRRQRYGSVVDTLAKKNPISIDLPLDEIVEQNNFTYKREPWRRNGQGWSMFDPDYRKRSHDKNNNGDDDDHVFKRPQWRAKGGFRKGYKPSYKKREVPLEERSKRPILIDGCNVAYAHSFPARYFSAKGIRICVDYFLNQGFTDITVVVPESRYHRLTKKNKKILDHLNEEGHIFYSFSKKHPSGEWKSCYDDRILLDIAFCRRGVVISNDHFFDMLEENPNWRNLIENRVIPCKFMPGCPDRIMIPWDPLGRGKPTLDEILRF